MEWVGWVRWDVEVFGLGMGVIQLRMVLRVRVDMAVDMELCVCCEMMRCGRVY